MPTLTRKIQAKKQGKRLKSHKKTTWGQGGVDDIKFYKSPYWRGVRQDVLDDEPYCRICKEKGTLQLATVVDHVKERHEGGTEDKSNLQPLCAKCHNLKSMNYGRSKQR